jgi:capsular exopolysaccharide synthesis family protein
MTILEAMEKAKRLRKERKVAEGAEATRELRAHAPKIKHAEFAVPRIKPPEFVRIAYDPRACEESRILVSDAEGPVKPGAADAYNMVRTRLLQRIRTSGWTKIAVTSPGPGEGKSITTINLALSIAREMHNSVFLLDLDLRNPSICRHLGLVPNVEIFRYLTGEVGPESMFFSIGVENLSIAGGLTRTEQSSELLANGRLEQLIDYIRSIASHPLILIDLPPALSTADALVIAPKVDATLLVVAQGKTRRESLDRTVELLSEYTVAGVVLNRSQELLSDYSGKYGAY